ncbi:MAG: extracellular solute-binding protein, partial [Verrucomicrobia bacterium]|nr:extracellular solute-binding protein [Verrucomicrobiota bacterium]
MTKVLRTIQGLGVALLIVGAVWLMFWRPHADSLAQGQTELKVKGLWIGLWPSGMANGVALSEFHKQHPDIAARNWVNFRIPGDLDIASELMSFAARTAPDVTFTYIHRFQFYVDQGFYHRLNAFIGEDTNGDGVLDPSEVRWKPWLDIPPLFRQMGMRGTDIHALPRGLAFGVMIYRPDLFAAAGLDPQNFPKDFPAFFRAGQKICALSLKKPESRRIYALPRNLDGFYQSLLWSGGGAPGRGELRGLDGRALGEALPEDHLGERIRALGLKPSQATVKWRAVFDDEPTRRALEAIWKLCWQPWILNPHTGEPLDLTPEDIERGEVKCPQTGNPIVLTQVAGGVQHGICRPARTQEGLGESDLDLLNDGELAMMPLQNNNVASFGKDYGKFGFALPPALEVGGKPAVIAIPMLYGLNADLRGDKLKAAWKFFSFQSGPDWNRVVTRYLLDHGYYESVSPLDAERFGFTDDLAKMPENWVRVNREAMKVARVIPYFAGYQQAETEFFAHTLHKIADSPQLDLAATLRNVQRDVDERILRPPGEGKGFGAKLFAVALLLGSVVAVGWGIRSVVRIPRQVKQPGRAAQQPSRTRLAFWCLVLPAVASVLLWNYYPMLRGFLL